MDLSTSTPAARNPTLHIELYNKSTWRSKRVAAYSLTFWSSAPNNCVVKLVTSTNIWSRFAAQKQRRGKGGYAREREQKVRHKEKLIVGE